TSIQVIDRMMCILHTITLYDGPVSLKYLSADTGLHPSTAFRILASMIEHGVVCRTERGQYLLGSRLGQLASHSYVDQDIKACAKSVMEKLRDKVDETVNLTLRQGDEVLYIDRSLSSRMMRVEQVIGSRAPLHLTAVGKLLLGGDGEAAIRQYSIQTGLPGNTRNSITDTDTLVSSAIEAYNRGYAFDNEEAEEGVGCVGSLIYDNKGLPIAGISISSPIDRRCESWSIDVQDAAMTISASLGYRMQSHREIEYSKTLMA
ncbi:MAG: IclR family transcriptional regulator, partial [Gammaproteobacteria bacterium]|nr:IclR family transcriptional regulator [Gammaproteobacteria bacterium]